MAEEEDELVDPLFLACTRPVMFLGVTLEAFAFNGMATMMIYLGMGSFKYLAVGLVMHLIFRLISWHDRNRFRVIVAWFETRGKCRNGMVWGGSSMTPLALGRTYSAKDFGDE